MKKLTSILSTVTCENRIKRIVTKQQFSDYVHESLVSLTGYSVDSSNQIVETLLSQYPDNFQKAIKQLEQLTSALVISEPVMPQMSTKTIEDDSDMQVVFKIADIISAFHKLHDAWLTENSSDWYSDEVFASLSQVETYINQLAAYITLSHSDILIQIQVDANTLKGKEFATCIRASDEWKELKKLLKMTLAFSEQPLTIRALSQTIIEKTKLFLRKM